MNLVDKPRVRSRSQDFEDASHMDREIEHQGYTIEHVCVPLSVKSDETPMDNWHDHQQVIQLALQTA